MADVTFQTTMPDAHIARLKAAAQGIFGGTYTNAQLKTKIEDGLWRHVKDIIVQWEQGEGGRIGREKAENEIQP